MQEFKGKVAFWAVIVCIIAAIISQSWETVGLLLLYLVIGIFVYQLLGRFFLFITRGAFDPMNIKARGIVPPRETKASTCLSQQQRERRQRIAEQLGASVKSQVMENQDQYLELEQRKRRDEERIHLFWNNERISLRTVASDLAEHVYHAAVITVTDNMHELAITSPENSVLSHYRNIGNDSHITFKLIQEWQCLLLYGIGCIAQSIGIYGDSLNELITIIGEQVVIATQALDLNLEKVSSQDMLAKVSRRLQLYSSYPLIAEGGTSALALFSDQTADIMGTTSDIGYQLIVTNLFLNIFELMGAESKLKALT